MFILKVKTNVMTAILVVFGVDTEHDYGKFTAFFYAWYKARPSEFIKKFITFALFLL